MSKDIKKLFHMIASLFIICNITILSAEIPLAPKKMIKELSLEVSGERAYRYTQIVSSYDRIPASEGYHAAAVWIKSELKKYGYVDIALESWPSDGTIHYGAKASVIGWRAKKAELWMMSPSVERLCSYDEIPITLVKGCHSALCEAELVDVGSGVEESSYRDSDVREKIVMATARPEDVMKEAVLKRGALGVLVSYTPEIGLGYPNIIRYTSVRPKWEERDKYGFGFNLSKEQSVRLKRILENGQKILLKVNVETEYYPSNLEVLSASLPGTDMDAEEIFLISHLCHPMPSANDNASGSGGLLEMARALKCMVDDGRINRPKRTIRFVWVPEYTGTMAYMLAHRDRMRRTLAGINCDMIGENFSKTNGMLMIGRTPDSLPSVLNDVVLNFAEAVEDVNPKSLNGSSHPMVWKSVPYSSGSDHDVFNDGAVRVPCVILCRGGDIFHHTSLDTMDKVDSTEILRSSLIALGAAVYLASASDVEAMEMARLTSKKGIGRISMEAHNALGSITKAVDPESLLHFYEQAVNVINHCVSRELKAIESAKFYMKKKTDMNVFSEIQKPLKVIKKFYLAEALSELRQKGFGKEDVKHYRTISLEESNLASIIPVRLPDFVGILDSSYIEDRLGENFLKEVHVNNDIRSEAINCIDGSRSILNIVKFLSAEYGFSEPKEIERFFDVLKKAGLITYNSKER